MDVFNILGPVMIGPSSSHTAGIARIKGIALVLLGVPAVKMDILLHGPLAETYKGRGIDKALIAGIMGMAVDDSRICMAPGLARRQGLEVTITTGDIGGAHPNTAEMTLTDVSGKTVSFLDSSIGGGNILVKEVNGMEVSITGQHITLITLHRGAPGTITAAIEVMADTRVNTYNFRLSRQQKGGEAVMTTEIDGSFESELDEGIRILSNIFFNTMLQPM